MPQSCCVPVCKGGSKFPLYRFPDPKRDPYRFTLWIQCIGGLVSSLNHQSIFEELRVCRKHFKPEHCLDEGIKHTAVPALHLPENSLCRTEASKIVPNISEEQEFVSIDQANTEHDGVPSATDIFKKNNAFSPTSVTDTCIFENSGEIINSNKDTPNDIIVDVPEAIEEQTMKTKTHDENIDDVPEAVEERTIETNINYENIAPTESKQYTKIKKFTKVVTIMKDGKVVNLVDLKKMPGVSKDLESKIAKAMAEYERTLTAKRNMLNLLKTKNIGQQPRTSVTRQSQQPEVVFVDCASTKSPEKLIDNQVPEIIDLVDEEEPKQLTKVQNSVSNGKDQHKLKSMLLNEINTKLNKYNKTHNSTSDNVNAYSSPMTKKLNEYQRDLDKYLNVKTRKLIGTQPEQLNQSNSQIKAVFKNASEPKFKGKSESARDLLISNLKRVTAVQTDIVGYKDERLKIPCECSRTIMRDAMKIKNLERIQRKLTSKTKTQKIQLAKHRKKITANPTFFKMIEQMSSPARTFIMMQMRYIEEKSRRTKRDVSKGMRFTAEEKNFALSLVDVSPEAYSFMESIFKLPTGTTLKKYLKGMINQTHGDDLNNATQDVTAGPDEEAATVQNEEQLAVASISGETTLETAIPYNQANVEHYTVSDETFSNGVLISEATYIDKVTFPNESCIMEGLDFYTVENTEEVIASEANVVPVNEDLQAASNNENVDAGSVSNEAKELISNLVTEKARVLMTQVDKVMHIEKAASRLRNRLKKGVLPKRNPKKKKIDSVRKTLAPTGEEASPLHEQLSTEGQVNTENKPKVKRTRKPKNNNTVQMSFTLADAHAENVLTSMENSILDLPKVRKKRRNNNPAPASVTPVEVQFQSEHQHEQNLQTLNNLSHPKSKIRKRKHNPEFSDVPLLPTVDTSSISSQTSCQSNQEVQTQRIYSQVLSQSALTNPTNSRIVSKAARVQPINSNLWARDEKTFPSNSSLLAQDAPRLHPQTSRELPEDEPVYSTNSRVLHQSAPVNPKVKRVYKSNLRVSAPDTRVFLQNTRTLPQNTRVPPINSPSKIYSTLSRSMPILSEDQYELEATQEAGYVLSTLKFS